MFAPDPGRVIRCLAAKAAAALTIALCLTAGLGALDVRPLSGQDPDPRDLTAAERAAVLDSMATVLEARYVFPDVAARIVDSLRADLSRGVYSRTTDPAAFASALSGRIRGLSGDGHLWVTYEPAPEPTVVEQGETSERVLRRRLARSNFGLPRAEVLPGNVGYLDIRGFVRPELGGDAMAAAMAFLANVDALILDMRQNTGGSPQMVALLASYLFDSEPVHLFDIYLRPADRTEQHWTLPYLPSNRLPDQPVYVLTRASTFSAGEGLAYILKHLDRATVVGETTAGGANPGAVHRLSDRFTMFVAQGRVVSPVTGGNWQGAGVIPDVAVDASLALDTAHRLALTHLLRAELGTERARELQALIEEIDDRIRRGGG